MTKYFKSGLCEGKAFYTKHELNFASNTNLWEDVEYNKELLAQHYQDHYYFTYDEEDEGDKWDQVYEQFWEALSYWNAYFEPMVFNEDIALECGLTPFTYKGDHMLALSACGMDLSPRLEAYQALVHGTIDERSKLLSKQGREWFEQVMGYEITQKALISIGYTEI